uniref:Uncharacterized protein n=1 Tax=viral metagenome TaxID=1070528 RepID=A0A6C0ESN5_9ZZZZ
MGKSKSKSKGGGGGGSGVGGSRANQSRARSATKKLAPVRNKKQLTNVYSSFILFFFIPIIVCLIKTFEIIKGLFNSAITTPNENNKYDSLIFIAVVLLSVYSVVKKTLSETETFIYIGIAILAFFYKVFTVTTK